VADAYARDYFTGSLQRPSLDGLERALPPTGFQRFREVLANPWQVVAAYGRYMGVRRDATDEINRVECVSMPVINGTPYPEMQGMCPRSVMKRMTTNEILTKQPEFMSFSTGTEGDAYFARKGVRSRIPIRQLITDRERHRVEFPQDTWEREYPLDLFLNPTPEQIAQLSMAQIRYYIGMDPQGAKWHVFQSP